MKALIICGSGNTDGFTYAMCGNVAEGMRESGEEVEVLDLSSMDIAHCTGCHRCSEKGECVIDDDMGILMSKYSDADILFLATPVRFSGPSSVIKTALDRFQPIWFGSERDHPILSAGILCGGSPDPKFSNIISIFKAFSITAGMKWVGELTIPGTDGMDSPEMVAKRSFDYGRDIVRWIRSECQ